MNDGLVGCDINENNASSEKNDEAAVLKRNIHKILRKSAQTNEDDNSELFQ